jgi:imidazolonepropionase-like amidohydrolase
MPMDEIRSLAEAKMTAMEILVAATRKGARVLRRGATLGTLEAGKQADVLVVRGDPLGDLEVLDDPLLVLHRGVVIRGEVPAGSGR